jgi:two-component system, NtrC family, nitrogen regulation sensor histidine kinase NtrY
LFTVRQKRILLTLGLAAAWLYTFSLLYQVLITNNDNPRKIIGKLERYIHKAEADFYSECKDIPNMLRLYNQSYDEPLLQKFKKKPYSLFVYQELPDSERQLKFWSANYAFPTPEHFLQPDYGTPVTLGNGIFEFCRKTVKVNNTRITVACLLPLRWEYFIENDYLKKKFAAIPGMEKKYAVSPDPTIYPVKNSTGQILMYLQEKKDERNTGYSAFVIITRLASVIFLLAMVYVCASVIAKKRSVWLGLAILVTGFGVLRLVSWFLPFPFDTSRLEIFDPRVYASGQVFRSLGDLIYTVVLFFLTVLFLAHHRPLVANTTKKHHPAKATLLTLLLVVLTLFCSWLIRSMIADSKISFNVTNFFSLDLFSLAGFVVTAITVLSYYLLSGYLLHYIHKWFPIRIFPYVITAIGGLLLLYLRLPIFNDSVNLFVLIWLLLYLFVFRIISPYRNNPKAVFRDDIVMLLFFSVSVCMLFTRENNKKELGERRILAEKVAFRSDPSSENLLSIAISRFDNNFLKKNSYRWTADVNGRSYKDTLVGQNFVGYLSKFATRIYTYDSTGAAVNNPDSTTLRTYRSIIETQATRLNNVPDLFYYEEGFDLYSYVYFKTIQDTSGKPLGYFIVHARPLQNKIKSDALYPELFRQRSDNFFEKVNNYVYAVYNKYELRKRFIDYDFPVRITAQQIPVHDDTLVKRKGYQELWYKINADSLVVIGKKDTWLISTVTLFAYLFFTFLLVTLLYRLVRYCVSRPPSQWWNNRFLQFSIRSQVQGIIVLTSLVSFFVIGITIISLFRGRFDKNNKVRLARAMSILVADVQNKLAEQSMFDDVVRGYEPGAGRQLEDAIYQMSEIHNVDFNIYGLDATLKFSSQPYVLSREIMGNKIDPVAYYNLKTLGSGQYVQEEKIGSFTFQSMYVPVRDEAGNAYGYLNIPYYSSRNDLKQEISNFLVTIINLNAFIFLIAGLIAWLITSRIIRSFLLIGEKMEEVNLGKNEVITWKRNDEIGDLVRKYNEMVFKLEASAARLAKSEREDAWREMARQVAHEIKNPLTPMKLSIQFLQKSITNGAENVQELTSSVTQTLVEQIDHLSKIAADFSQFANIGNTKATAILLHEQLEQVAGLFSAEDGAVITVSDNRKDTMIFADKTQVNRLFTNLVKNALQSYDDAPHKPVTLEITSAEDKYAVIQVSDQGPGIGEDVREKIFTPNFTTKTSGTGLGLAISKGITEQAGGEIWFETSEQGTSFFVKLPLSH